MIYCYCSTYCSSPKSFSTMCSQVLHILLHAQAFSSLYAVMSCTCWGWGFKCLINAFSSSRTASSALRFMRSKNLQASHSAAYCCNYFEIRFIVGGRLERVYTILYILAWWKTMLTHNGVLKHIFFLVEGINQV